MSSSLRKPQRRPGLRLAMPGGAATTEAPIPMHCSHRSPGDDFFCLRYGVWYGSLDCAIRSRFRTCPGCFDCDQGRFNLKRHAAGVSRLFTGWRRPGGE